MDTFFEQIIAVKKNGKAVAAIIGIWLAAFIVCFLLIMFMPFLGTFSLLLAAGALTWQSLAVYCASGFAMDAVQAISTVIFLWFFTEPMLDKLERVKIKYGFA